MDSLLMTIASWMETGSLLAVGGAFAWGMVSVLLSPCHLASIPLIVGYVAGQERLVEGRQAMLYAGLFTSGLFTTIAALGVICAALGQMLGAVSPYWGIAVGLVLLWVALDMLGLARCSLHGGLLGRLRLRGPFGALILGLAYGVLSGSCTFGFIAPILAIITVQGQVAQGTLLILAFGLGHCLPIAVAGSCTAWIRRLVANARWQRGSTAFRRLAGVGIAALGLFFLLSPWRGQ